MNEQVHSIDFFLLKAIDTWSCGKKGEIGLVMVNEFGIIEKLELNLLHFPTYPKS